MRLLISVVNVDEAREAVLGGADIIDVKNPREGSLGAQPPAVVHAIRLAVPASIPVSVALGDLPDLPGTAALAALGAAVLGVQYVKAGLLGPRSLSGAAGLLVEVCRAAKAFNPGIRVVAVGFADGPLRGCIASHEVVEAAALAGVDGCMLDTLDKTAGHRLLDVLPPPVLRRFTQQAHGHGMEVALAGSLREDDVPLVSEIGADIVGIRGAACLDDRRLGRIAQDRVARIRQMIPAAPPVSPRPCPGGAASPPGRDRSR